MKEEITMTRKRMDCKGIACPKPLIQISKAARELTSGDEIVVEATDPNFTIDVHAWAERTGNSIVSVEEDDDKMTVLIRVI